MIEVDVNEVFVINEGKSEVIQVENGVVTIADSEGVLVDTVEVQTDVIDLTQDGTADLNLVQIDAQNVDVVDLEQGPQGPQGPAGNVGGVVVSGTTGEAINATQVVYKAADGLFYKADNTDLTHAETIVGIAKTSVGMSAALDVLTFGEIVDGAFAVYPNETKLFLNGIGALSATPPTTGFSIIIGKKSDNNSFFVDLDRAIFLI